MSEYRKNWRKYQPPMIPIYYMDFEQLKVLLAKDGLLSDIGLEMMLGFFEEYEEFEKAALVRDAKFRMGLFGDDDPNIDGVDVDYFDEEIHPQDEDEKEDINPYKRKNPFK